MKSQACFRHYESEGKAFDIYHLLQNEVSLHRLIFFFDVRDYIKAGKNVFAFGLE